MNNDPFEEHLLPCYNDAVRFARNLAGSVMEGDDLLQDSLVRAWKGFPRLKERDKFSIWLFTIIRNTFHSRRRLRWWKMMTGIDTLSPIPAPEDSPVGDRDLVRLALRALPLVQREAVILFEVVGLSVAEVAQVQRSSQVS